MKKVLNIIGYISLLAIPDLLLLFIFEYHDLVKLLSLIILLIIIIIQGIHYKKTKIKNYGIRIFITIVLFSLLSFIIYNGYGIIKNNQAKELIKKIERISFETYEITQKQLDNNLKFVNTKSLIIKDESDATIYYKDGTIEKTKVYNINIIQIKNDKYYLNVL